jgi:hypothetical protein
MGGPQVAAPDDITQYGIQLEPPGPQRIFRLEPESSLHIRMQQEAKQRPSQERLEFPEEPVVTGGDVHRHFEPMQLLAEPNYVCYNRLYFEDLNTERYGWDLGPIQPFVSAAKFYADLLALPYHFWTDPCRCYECSAGYCLPGDPVPYLIYPPEFSLTGLTAEAVTVVGLMAMFP